MRVLAATALVLAALVPAAPAGAEGVPNIGLLCGSTTISDPRANVAGGWVELDGGPLTIDEATFGSTGPATLTCTVQHWSDLHHGDPDVASATSPATSGVVVLPPTLVPVPDKGAYYALCAQVDVAGSGTFYWDDRSDPTTTAGWSRDPSSGCSPPLVADCCGGPNPLAELVWATVDSVACPPLEGPLADAEPVWGAVWPC